MMAPAGICLAAAEVVGAAMSQPQPLLVRRRAVSKIGRFTILKEWTEPVTDAKGSHANWTEAEEVLSEPPAASMLAKLLGQGPRATEEASEHEAGESGSG
mmetsp:Transcript_82327/g.228445  ORF Transcript_82327/g.228445 Transcript_82327/m.228445 type:complete len:100 (-) Transcript_82327:212-511(-)